MKSRILVVSADAEMRATLGRWLIAAGYAVEPAEGEKHAREVAATQSIALAMVAVQSLGDARADAARQFRGLASRLITIGPADAPAEAPVDAHIRTPLNHDEVLERVSAALRPATANASDTPDILRFEGYTLDAAARTCVGENGAEVALTRAEFTTLLNLARQAGRVVSRDELRRAVAGREAGPDDRSVDMLISRLRRKIERDAKDPRIIVTVPGEGYRFTPHPQAVAPPPAILPTAVDAAATPPPARGRRIVPLRLIGSIAAAAVVVVAAIVWYPGDVTRPYTTAAAARKFDAAVIPFLDDATRASLASYPTSPDYKALAISPNHWAVIYEAPDPVTAKARALEACGREAKNTKVCSIYSTGMDVIWPANSPPLPLASDRHSAPIETSFLPTDIPIADEQARRYLNGYYARVQLHKALAVTQSFRTWTSSHKASAAEAERLTVEKCGESFATPCLILAIDGRMTVQIPKTRRITGVFMVTTEPGLGDAERAALDRVYRGKEWRALARGASGGWFPVADAASEAAAIEAALAACGQHDKGCRIYAIGNFRVGDETPPANAPIAAAAQAPTFDPAAMPFVEDAVRIELAGYPGWVGPKAIAIADDGWGASFGATDQQRANVEAIERCRSRSKSKTPCRLYASGMNVVWGERSVQLPPPADIHREPVDVH